MSEQQIKVPDIGDFDEVAVIEVLVKAGDTVKAEQSLITVESDKASMEIPSSHAGVVKSLAVKVGDKVNEGSVVLTLELAEGAAAPAPAPARTGSRASAPPKQAPHPLRPLHPRTRRPPHRPTPARSTSNATCWCSAPAPAAIRPPSVPPTSASRWCWSSAMPRWAASA